MGTESRNRAAQPFSDLRLMACRTAALMKEMEVECAKNKVSNIDRQENLARVVWFPIGFSRRLSSYPQSEGGAL